MAGLAYRFTTLIIAAALCGIVANAQNTTTQMNIPEEFKNGITTLINTFAGGVPEMFANNAGNADDILEEEVNQIVTFCEVSAICPKNFSTIPAELGLLKVPLTAPILVKAGKLLKPKIWKVGLVMKIGFLKLLLIKKLILIKSMVLKVKAKIVAIPILLKSPIIILPIIMKAIVTVLVSQLMNLDSMLDSYETANGTAVESVLADGFLNTLNPFSGLNNSGDTLLDFVSLFTVIPGMLNSFQQADSAMMSALGSNGLFSSFTNPSDDFLTIADMFRSGLMNFGNLVTPNLRRLQSVSSFRDISGFQNLARDVLAESMLDIVSLAHYNDAARREFNEFVSHVRQSNPELLAIPLKDEFKDTIKVSESVQKILGLRGDYEDDKIVLSVDALNNAITDYKSSIRKVRL